jgi:MFS family permease
MSNQLPEPLAHPGILDEPAGSMVDGSLAPAPLATVRSRVGTKRLSLALFIVGLCWVAANGLAAGNLLAAKIAILDPENKVFLLGLATALAGGVTSISLFVWGAVSDLTRSPLGRRTPWIIFGAISGAAGLVLMGISDSMGGLIAAFLGYGLLFNALPAAVLAVFPDRIPVEKRGTASAVYGGAQVIGGATAGIISSQFLSDPNPLYYAGAIILLAGGLLFAALAPDFSSKDEPRAALDLQGLKEAFKFPANASDFYWAFAGRFLLLLGLYMVQNFTLYILTDYIGLSNEESGSVLAISGFASLLTIVIGTFVAGPLSDRIKRRKMPIFLASLLFGLAVVFPMVWPTAESMITFGAVSGLGLGAFLAVDAALMTEVLPSEDNRGKDLGILNTANTVPGIIAPLVTSAIVGVGLGYVPVFGTSLVVILIGAVSIFKIKSVR